MPLGLWVACLQRVYFNPLIFAASFKLRIFVIITRLILLLKEVNVDIWCTLYLHLKARMLLPITQHIEDNTSICKNNCMSWLILNYNLYYVFILISLFKILLTKSGQKKNCGRKKNTTISCIRFKDTMLYYI